jgi:hypothetical protein
VTWNVYGVSETRSVKVHERISGSVPQAVSWVLSTVSFEVTVYLPTGAPAAGSSQVRVKLVDEW